MFSLSRFLARPGARPLALAAATALPAVFLAAPAHAAGEQTYAIPPGTLNQALNAFSAASDTPVSAGGDLTRGKTSAGLNGRYTVEEGLARLLQGSGLEAYRQPGVDSYLLRPAPAPATTTLPTVNVVGAAQSPTGPGQGFVAETSLAGAKTNTSLLETPQTISVTTRAQLDAQQATNLTQAARYIPGVYFGDNTDTRNEYFKARGFTLDQYQDGLKLLTQGAWIENKVDPFFLDRIEVLEGPSSGLYGQSSPGGLVNLVSKRPTDTPFGQIQLQTGTYGRAQLGVDVGGRLNDDGSLTYRVTGLARDTGTQVDRMREQRVAIAPAITWKSADTRFTLLASYLKDPEGGFWSSLPYSGTLLDNPALPGGKLSRRLNTGQPDYEDFKRERGSLGYEFEHRFNDRLTVKQNFRYSYVDSTYNALQAYKFVSGTSMLMRDNYMYSGRANSVSLDNQALFDFRTGPLVHKALAGLDYQYVDRHDFSRYGAGPDLNVLAPDYGMTITDPKVNLNRQQTFQQWGVYAQDQIGLDRLQLTLTGRQDRAVSVSRNNLTSARTDQDDSKFTGRAGLSYQFDSGVAPYVSYSTSFNPSTGSSFGGDAFKPTTGQQYEAGVKYKPQGWDGLFTASVFDLKQQNVLTTDPVHSGYQVQTGEVRVRGVELSAVSNLSDSVSMTASYTHLNPEVTKDNAGLEGNDPADVPRNNAKLWVDYTVRSGPLAGLGVGGGVRYIGSQYADTANVYKIGDAVLFDAALRYDLGYLNSRLKGWNVSINAANIADKVYVSDCSDISCRWGQGRTIYATVDYRW
ncbi:hypothetical protein CAL29_04075 [Bordetella genomosp. 10]|uniref:Secretin/TonB short N-terminal domain-containing protein n=1 Tax=Bordetella genomosp. 10 TaxID=1416804 RepID=A0A261SJG9_9BORD|nr:TonB-dependent siderophore receptor [Bordetella genomosp. 10]OZI37588.1 hypothetical protein CAL29_04075 [Bordetella genomosp. 10]